MRRLFAVLAVVGLVALAGWDNVGAAESGTFRIMTPKLPTTVKPGSSAIVTILVKRTDFTEDMSLSASVTPPNKGVTVEVKPKTHKADDPSEVRVKILVEDKAPPGEYKVKITAAPPKGLGIDATLPVRVEVKK